MALLSCSNLKLSFGDRLILETPPLTINAQAPTGYLIWERV